MANPYSLVRQEFVPFGPAFPQLMGAGGIRTHIYLYVYIYIRTAYSRSRTASGLVAHSQTEVFAQFINIRIRTVISTLGSPL